ncbi:MAG: T9SS C-terminal target domain-containing protein [Ignavibacteriales bacterium]|nr:MAG: T9SS C-terminal target domain-containing protein [Ignavibacteriales bacterium]
MADLITMTLNRLNRKFLILAVYFFITAIAYSQTISFNKSDLNGVSLYYPTSLQFGPDGRLYIAQVDGTIKVLTVVRNYKNNYSVIKTETINEIRKIVNHDDDGKLNTNVTKRQITGILVTGTAENPVIYVSSSDPRVGAGLTGNDVNLDTNSGIVSKLIWDGTKWIRIDLVRGLPRSEENHSPNGMALDETNGILYLAMGGHTNMGALSANLAHLPEFALSAAILSIDLKVIGETTYDLPTLDDEDRVGVNDENDPFGGNDGKNQAAIVPGGPVQVYSPGYRNPYDILIATSGKIYVVDNGSNAGWGGAPTDCSNDTVEGGKTYPDGLHLISKDYYGGHPNLARASRSNTFNITNPQSPIPVGYDDPRQCTYLIPGVENFALATFPESTNGLSEYTATNFNSEMKGNLLAAGFDGRVYRIILNESGDAVVPNGKIELFSNFGDRPLDLVAQSDDDVFPGTIWVANLISNTITIFEPNDVNSCDISDPLADADGDGYSNQDEQLNISDPCSPASIPEDWDKDKVSDLLDADDDNDGIPDTSDFFALDNKNGETTKIPFIRTWNNDDLQQGGIMSMGFTGLMTNGVSNYKDLFNTSKMTAGGAAGVFTLDEISPGDAYLDMNNQEQAFQFGVNVKDFPGIFEAHTRINAPFAGFTPVNYQSMGMFIGTGDQDNYFKIVCAANDSEGGIEILFENNMYVEDILYSADILNKSFIDLYLIVDPVAKTVLPGYSIEAGPIMYPAGSIKVPDEWISNVLAVGIISTSREATPFPVTWDMIEVVPLKSTSQAWFGIIPPYSNVNTYNQSTYNPKSFQVRNDSPDGQKIKKLIADISHTLLPDLVFDPDGTAGDIVGKGFTPDSNATEVGLGNFQYKYPEDGGYTWLEVDFTDFNPGEFFAFSIDVDPTSIHNSNPPGPRGSGSVSGIELIGANVMIMFDDNSVQIAQPFRIEESKGGSQNIFTNKILMKPRISIEGQPELPSIVSNPEQIVEVIGQPNTDVSVLIAEGGMFLSGVPDGGVDVDPFEANSFISLSEVSAHIGEQGNVEVPVTLYRTDSDSGGFNYIVAVIKDSSGKTSDISNIAVLELRSGAFSPIRISCGSTTDVYYENKIFSADKNFSQPSGVYSNQNIADIKNTIYDDLYKTERNADPNSKKLDYSFTVPNGNYSVWLHFAEIYFGATGGYPALSDTGLRKFDVKIEDDYKLIDFDIIKEVGSMAMVKKNFNMLVTDGTLDINFISKVNRAKISAIEILSPVDIPLSASTEKNNNLHFSLKQNYPNPFNPTTRISYSVSKPGIVKLYLFNVLGELVSVLLNDYKDTGEYTIDFNASSNGIDMPSGVYFYKLVSEGYSETRKMILLR